MAVRRPGLFRDRAVEELRLSGVLRAHDPEGACLVGPSVVSGAFLPSKMRVCGFKSGRAEETALKTEDRRENAAAAGLTEDRCATFFMTRECPRRRPRLESVDKAQTA